VIDAPLDQHPPASGGGSGPGVGSAPALPGAGRAAPGDAGERAAAPATRRAMRPSRSATVLMLHARALAHESFDAAAADVIAQLALLLPCERASLGLKVHGKVRVVAISGAAEPARRHAETQRLAAAMAEALDQRTPLSYPLPPGASPTVTVAHRALAQHRGGAILTVPIATRHELLGALLFERREAFDHAVLEAAKDAAMFVGPTLALKHRVEGAMSERVARALGHTTRAGAVDRAGMPWRRVAVAVAALVLAALAAVPTTHHVVAHARVEGTVQQVISAPFEGFVGTVDVRPGDTVTPGQVLMTLDAREQALERDQAAADAAQLDKQYREALSRDEAAAIVTARAKLDAARSRHEFALRQIERATLRSPLDGVVLSGDFTQAVGAPLERGQELMTIAPDRGWRIVAEVDERDIGHVRHGQRAVALFAAGGGGDDVAFEVARIAPVSAQADGRNVFEVEGAPHTGAGAAATTLRPGMRGVVRIAAGERPLALTWWAKARHALRRLAWQLAG
jgi:multidrug efflux pump subunit AcrA (membrane-fusion protein)